MKYARLLIVLLFAGVLLTAVSLSVPVAIAAQDTQQTTQTDTSKTTTTTITGFPTGTKCTKTDIYQAENKYLKVMIVVAEGEEFPPFVDGQKTTWYVLTASTRTTFDAVKVSPGSN